ncbi:MAG: adenylate kinase [Erysipelotrichaceae bacterium]|nr:adenylate kinase [Erysipelotrichaceae bacterium]
MNLLIIGAPGAGKGTMSKMIVETFNVVHVSTGDMLRQAIKDETEIGKLAKGYIDKGDLVPDSVINDIIVDRLNKDDIKNGFLFDGYPRTVKQAESLAEILKGLGKEINAVINLEVSDDILIKRIEGRRLCPKCGASYNVFFSAPQVEGHCDKCGSSLYIRADDNAETVKNRLVEFRQNTQPVIEYYEKLNLVHNISANADRYVVFDDIKKTLEGIE